MRNRAESEHAPGWFRRWLNRADEEADLENAQEWLDRALGYLTSARDVLDAQGDPREAQVTAAMYLIMPIAANALATDYLHDNGQ